MCVAESLRLLPRLSQPIKAFLDFWIKKIVVTAPHSTDELVSFIQKFPECHLISCESSLPRLVSCDRSRRNQWACLPLRQHLGELRDLRSGAPEDALALVLDKVLASVLPFVERGGKVVTIEDVLVLDLLTQSGTGFPFFHTDSHWDAFTGDGFQVWYLLENDDEEERGNMYLLEYEELSTSTPTYLIHREGEVFAVRHGADGTDPCTRGEPIQCQNAKLSYLSLKPGDCLVMGPWTAHATDPRPASLCRRALSFRVAVCDVSHGGVLWKPKLTFLDFFFGLRLAGRHAERYAVA